MNQDALTHMLALIHRIEEWAYNYYVLDAPVVPDYVYDDALRQLKAFEKDRPELVTPDSPTQRVMGQPVDYLKPAKHNVRMLSIRTETDQSDEPLKNFNARVMKELGLEIRYHVKGEKRSTLNGCTFAFTGVLKTMTRADAGVDILAAGGQVSESVSKKTDYLVVGENPGGKLDKAVKLGVRVIDESAFKSMLEKGV